MNCPACGRAIRDDARFCDGCGQRLGEVIAADRAREPRAYTPQHLAEKILGSRRALEGERKQVTVLFADVKGSMELAEQLDPEDWHRIMDRFFHLLAEGVHRFEGTVNQYTGDGIMALFGAPIAHEDHAQRACWAALHLAEALRVYAQELKREHGLGFSVRMGLNSGEVIVGTIGDDLRMDYTAQGHTVGLAARMEQLASPDTIYLTEHTARLVTGYFDLRDLERFQVKGVREPVGVYQLRAVGQLRTRLDASRARGFTRFVGRAAETTLLDTALARAVAGEAQVVGVVGEAGVGKSRLCFELVERSRARGVPVYEAHCVSHGRALPFLPILQLFRSYFDIAERDDPAVARRKIAGTLVLLDDRFREVLPLVFDFLGVPDPERPLPPMDPDARQRQLVGFVSELGRARSAREPAVILVDDLHWIDPASDALLARFLDSVGGTRTVVLLNFRPEYQAEWMQRADYQQIALRPLGREAVEELLTALLGTDRSLAPVRARIGERAGGNPFFVEELVQSLVEGGQLAGAPGAYRWAGDVEDLVIPPTVQGALAARIDRLPEAAKAVLQTAAVIGREFTEPVLRRVVERPAAELSSALATLTRAELVLEQVLYPEAVYAFKHPLTHEVAYRSQLAERRRRVHGRVAEALVDVWAGSLDERSPLVAQHWEEAGDALQALRWHARAGEWLGTREPVEAMRHWQAVRRLFSEVPESPETLAVATTACLWVLNLQWRVGLSGEEEVAHVFAQGKALAERSANLAACVQLLYAYGSAIAFGAGRYREGLAHVEEALALAEKTDDLEQRVALHQRLSYLHSIIGNPAETLRFSDRGMALAGGDIDLGAEWVGYSPHLLMMVARGRSLMLRGQLAEATAILERAERLAIENGDQEAAAGACIFGSDTAVRSGDTGGALCVAARAFELCERSASPFFRVMGSQALAEALVEAGEWNEAIAAGETGLEVVRRQNRIVDAELRLVGALAQAEALAAAIPDRFYEARLRLERAELARLGGDEAGRRRLLVEAQRLFTEMGATARAARVAQEIGS